MSFVTSQVYKAATATEQIRSIALVTGAKTGIGLAVARKIASFPFIEHVVAVSRSITQADTTAVDPKLVPLAADVATESGRQAIVDKVAELCGGRTKQLRFLIHAAGTIHPITSVLKLKPAELRQAMLVNCEGPFFLTTALHSYMQPIGGSNRDSGLSGRVLHVSSGAAHGAPPVGWGAYGITKAAFFQTFRVLEHEFRDTGVVVGSFKPGVVDTDMQGVIRTAPDSDMPLVQKFIGLKEKAAGSSSSSSSTTVSSVPRPPPAGALDTPDNVAYFAEFLLLGTTDEEFANAQDASEWDIRHAQNFSKWIPAANLPQDE
mmetsp:Transcript_26855/g.50670  ORF Transcript_26855/g.50670 Transcript_26855/m.50670 type:complete len:318 (-) Transcript_26855:130-1083(-)|eukprot:scaffold1569_cov171-Amphora_coffeaeformis.AAC.12